MLKLVTIVVKDEASLNPIELQNINLCIEKMFNHLNVLQMTKL